MMVLLYPCFFSECSVLTILDAAAPVCLGVHTYSNTDSPHILLHFPHFHYIIRPMYSKFNLVVTAFLTGDGQEVLLIG